MINHLTDAGNRRFTQVFSLLIVLSFLFAPLRSPAQSSGRQVTLNSLTETATDSSGASATPSPAPTPLPYIIAPASGAQGKQYEVIVTSNECLKNPTGNPIDKLIFYAPDGSGINVASSSASNCHIMAKLSIAPDAPFGITKLWLTKLDSNNKPIVVESLDFAVTGVTPQPIPPGLNNKGQVDVMWAVVPNKIANHNFGRDVSNHFFCIEVVIGNDSGYDLQLSGIGFTLPALGNGYRIPNSGYRTVRGSLEGFGEVSPRKLAINGLKTLGPLLTGFLPFFHAVNHQANFSAAINLIDPLEKGLESVWPDLLPTQLDRLADQTYRDDVSTKTIIPNNVQARILTFVPKRLVCPPDKKTCPSGDPNRTEPLNAKNDQDVMRALGQIVIVGQEVVHVNRVRVLNTPFGSSVTDHSISGKVADACGTGVAGVTMTLSASGFMSRSVDTNADGTYTFANVPDGRTYTILPKLDDAAFSPSSSIPFPLNDTKTNVDFATGYLIVGKITSKDGKPLEEEIPVTPSGGGLTSAKPMKAAMDGTFRFVVPVSGAAPNLKVTATPAKYTLDGSSTADWSCDKRNVNFVVTKKPG